MFVRTARLDAALDRITELEAELAERDLTITHQTRQYESLHHQFTTANAAYTAAVDQLQRKQEQMYERLIRAAAAGEKADALIAFWTVRVNQLQHERDQLLARALPGLDVITPQVQTTQTIAPVVSFEHDPYASGLDSDHQLTRIPDDADLGGLAGTLYNPDPATEL